ncbi:cytoplasmic dynein 2 intermediate chain 1 isoform X1 [Pleurodeles waltl]|uniref:cytoplasmic dynein 2 intermediate chain 1 isoform X1 n=1 Tax=Pleurodeles waltl TaxID=8319 RepID=UPI00370970BC
MVSWRLETATERRITPGNSKHQSSYTTAKGYPKVMQSDKPGNSDAHLEEKRLKERRHRREGSASRTKVDREKREKDIHKTTDKDNERQREKYKEKSKDGQRERDGRKGKDWGTARDLNQEKGQEQEKQMENESEKKSEQRDIYAEYEHSAKIYGYKDEEVFRTRQIREASARKRRVDDRDKGHKERKERKEKDGISRENSGNKDNYRRSLEHKDEVRELRRRSMTEQDLILANKEREKRHRERKDHENADKYGKQRHRNEDKERDGEKKSMTFKDATLNLTDKNLKEKNKERRHGDKTSLDLGRERRQRDNREKISKEEYKMSKDHARESKHRSGEKSGGQDADFGANYAGHRESEQKSHTKLKEGSLKTQNGDHTHSAWTSIHRQTSDEEEEIEKDDNNDGHIYRNAEYEDSSTNYEEDFEAYDDDFEDEEEEFEPEEEVVLSKNPEVEEIQRAISAENDMVATIPSRHNLKGYEEKHGKEISDVQKKGSHRGVFIDFISAKQRQISRKMASKQKKRSTELLRLIDLDFSITFSLLDLSPVNEYDMYIRSFGKTNTKQAYVQCNDDSVEQDIQTENIETEEKWTQYPGEGARVSGGPSNTDSEFSDAVSIPKVDSQKLASFLRSACQVVAVLLEEDQAEKQSSWKLRSQEASLSISDGCFQLNMNLQFLHDRKVCCLHFSQVQRHVLISVHGLPANPGAVPLDDKYIVCVWNIWEPSTPLKILVCESEVKCCCFGPGKATLVFAGTADGSVVVWDLREDSNMHHSMMVGDCNWVFRSTTFSTDGVLTSVNHVCPVQAIEPISTTVFKEKNRGLIPLTSEEEMAGLSFQVASLDENGHLNLWVVMEMQKVDLAGSQSDLGLIPGGKVKLVHSSTINLLDSFLSKDIHYQGIPQTLNIKILPSDSNHFIIGTDIGLIFHGTRHGSRVPPKLYRPHQRGTRPSKVTAVDFSPFGEPIFLVGCSDGSIRLHLMSVDLPVMHWDDCTNGHPVIAVQWSLTRPSVFFVLDAASTIYIWDLLESDFHPVAKDSVRSDRVITMAVLGEPEKNNGLSGLALAKESGALDVQYIKKKWAQTYPEEPNRLNLLLHEAL